MACIDFLSGYFPLHLAKESQPLTVFNTEFGHYLFFRAPLWLSSSGDSFNSNTDRFYSDLGDYLLKQVDDMYIQAILLSDLEAKLRVAAREALDHNCTWCIGNFFAGRASRLFMTPMG